VTRAGWYSTFLKFDKNQILSWKERNGKKFHAISGNDWKAASIFLPASILKRKTQKKKTKYNCFCPNLNQMHCIRIHK